MAPDRNRAVREVAGTIGASTLWGLGLPQIHERYWASRGLQVVRPGGPTPSRKGPELFLLVPTSVSVDFSLGGLLRTFAWIRPKAVRIRLIEKTKTPYSERVIREPDGKFVAFERRYDQRGVRAAQIWMTPSFELAEAWRQAKSSAEAHRLIRRSVSRSRTHVVKISGRIFETRTDAGQDTFWRHVLKDWKNPVGVVDGVYQPSPGVWIHETCQIDPKARIIGPVWLGAGHRLGPGDTLVGPAIVPDEPLITPNPGSIDWWDVTHSGWRLIPSIRRRPIRNLTKRGFDIIVSLCVLGVTLPMFPILMLLIWREDGGSPFYIHQRQRFGGRTFGCIKFRTMKLNADEIKAKMIEDNLADGPQFFVKDTDDERLLRHGGWMRRYKIDEFPQFINVLLGHMSIVGPRPSPDKENQYCPAWREARLSVRPGITGLWQVASERKPQTDFQEWIRYDLEYVQTNSWRLDLAIIVGTIKKILS
ncbi:MAG: sugar transferase [Planctomycetota bacterium]